MRPRLPRDCALAGEAAHTQRAVCSTPRTRAAPALLLRCCYADSAGSLRALARRAAVPMRGQEQAIHHSKAKMLAQQAVAAGQRKARVQQLDAYTYDDWSNTVQIGDKDHEWKAYVPEESVMGKPYEDKPFDATINSVPAENTAREAPGALVAPALLRRAPAPALCATAQLQAS